jgi:hypothetical protein
LRSAIKVVPPNRRLLGIISVNPFARFGGLFLWGQFFMSPGGLLLISLDTSSRRVAQSEIVETHRTADGYPASFGTDFDDNDQEELWR